MMTTGPSAHVWIVVGHADMRPGMHGLSAMVQTALSQSPFSSQVFVFRGRRSDLIKILWFDGDGLYLILKKLVRGRFGRPQAESHFDVIRRGGFPGRRELRPTCCRSGPDDMKT